VWPGDALLLAVEWPVRTMRERAKLSSEERQKLWPILFWGSKFTHRDGNSSLIDATGALVELFFKALKIPADPQPQDCINQNIPRADRIELARALVNGQDLEAYLGYANCRICNKMLGSRDLTGWGFMWPEKAEHYILDHDVWTPGCSRLLAAVRTT